MKHGGVKHQKPVQKQSRVMKDHWEGSRMTDLGGTSQRDSETCLIRETIVRQEAWQPIHRSRSNAQGPRTKAKKTCLEAPPKQIYEEPKPVLWERQPRQIGGPRRIGGPRKIGGGPCVTPMGDLEEVRTRKGHNKKETEVEADQAPGLRSCARCVRAIQSGRTNCFIKEELPRAPSSLRTSGKCREIRRTRSRGPERNTRQEPNSGTTKVFTSDKACNGPVALI